MKPCTKRCYAFLVLRTNNKNKNMEFKGYLNRHVSRPAIEGEVTPNFFQNSESKPFNPSSVRAFDAHHGATKFHQLPFLQKKLETYSKEIETKGEKIPKTKIKESVSNKETLSPEMHAYYFMELAEEKQDDLLVEHKIIVPDAIRKDLQKMSEFIANCKNDIENFVPINKIFELLD